MSDEIKIEYRPLAELARWPRNPKQHDIPAIQASIRRWGFVNPLVPDDETDRLVAGHGRLEALMAMQQAGEDPPARIKVKVGGGWLVPCLSGVKFASEQEAEGFLLADNRLVELGGWDQAGLTSMLEDLQHADAIEGTGWSDQEVTAMLTVVADQPAFVAGNTDPDHVPELPPVPITKPGDLWILGNHRLLCGDSTKSEDATRLMNGEQAVLMATDPPYGVDYTAVKSGMPGFKDFGDIENDDLKGDGMRSFLDQVLAAALPVCTERAAFYLWHPPGAIGVEFRAALVAVNILIHRQIIWKKPGFILTRSGMYHWAHENCFYGWRQGNIPPWYGEKNQSSVWELGRDGGNSVHPTQKPVAVFEIPMANHTLPGEVCYEPFSGSGSQIIAGQRFGRRVYAMELSPKYCDAAVTRWESFTGLKAVRQH